MQLTTEVRADSSTNISEGNREMTSVDKTIVDVIDDQLPLVKFGEDVITVGQFKKSVKQLSQTQRLFLMQDEESRKRFIDKLIDLRLVYREAQRMGLDRDPEVIEQIEMAKEHILVNKYLDNIIRQEVKVTTEAMETFYKKNKERFVVSEAIKIRHILLPSEEEARDILERLKKGEDFATLAMENSIDPSGQHGGELGWIEKRVLDPDLARAAFALKKGNISEVVESKYGYHILRVEDKKPPVYKELEQVKDMVNKMVAQQEENRLSERIRDRLRQDLVISIDDNLMKSIKIDIVNSEDDSSHNDFQREGGD